MTCILAHLPDEGIKWLDQLATEQDKSRGEVLSMIIRWYRKHIGRSK